MKEPMLRHSNGIKQFGLLIVCAFVPSHLFVSSELVYDNQTNNREAVDWLSISVFATIHVFIHFHSVSLKIKFMTNEIQNA